MRSKSPWKRLALLLKKAYFTSQEARDAGFHPALVAYYVKKGLLKRIRRGVYQSAEYENPNSFRWGDLVEAVHCIKGGVVCLISALAIYDLTEQIPRQHWIAIKHASSSKPNRELKLVRFRNLTLGKTCVQVEGVEIPIFDRERTIVDAFRYLSLETALKALKLALSIRGKNRIDLAKLNDYARKLRVDIRPYLLSFLV